MGKTDPHQDEKLGHSAADAAAAEQATEQAQLSFFETVTPPTMSSENSPTAEPLQNESADATAAGTHDHEAAQSVETGVVRDEPSEAAAAVEAAEPEAADNAPVILSESLGQRLRAAREARGMRIEDAAQRMKLPLSTVQALESDRYERIGEGIYLRSYLSKYLRLLDMPLVLAERVLDQHAAPPPLITSGTISRPRYLFERYSSSALYVILTAVIIVPAVWLAMRAGFEPSGAQITLLDGPSVAISPAANGASDGNDKPVSADKQEAPLVASMAPFPAITHEASEPEPAAKQAQKPAVPLAPGTHVLRLTLPEASWVEITAADGEKLEYGLLPASTVRTYQSAKALDVRLGNASGASIELDGKAQDLTPYRRSNVAHFKLGGGESGISHSGG